MPAAAKLFRGPVEAVVVEVLDGDTFLAEALVWPGHTRAGQRPHPRHRRTGDEGALRDREHARRSGARGAGLALFGDRPVAISNIAGAKYYGRVLADVSTADGRAGGPDLAR